MSRATVDWNAVRGRLRKSEEALREMLSDDPARMKVVFRQRAVLLARPREAQAVSARTPALVFRLGEERHAIALSEVAEVLPFRDCTPVPGSAHEFSGVISLRGELRPVVDLARVLSTGASTNSGVILMLRRQAGMKVDGVEELREIEADGSGMLTLLNVERVLSAVLSGAQQA